MNNNSQWLTSFRSQNLGLTMAGLVCFALLFACSGSAKPQNSAVDSEAKGGIEDSSRNRTPGIILNDFSKQISQVVRIVYQDQQGRIWFGTENGAFVVVGDSLTHIDGIQSEIGKGVSIKSIAEGKDGRIWFGHTDGLSVMEGDSVTNYYESDGLLNNDVWCIEVDASGTVWVGTYEGLCRFDGQVFTPFSLPEGQIDTNLAISSTKMVHRILEDSSGGLWFCTNAGLFSYKNNRLKHVSKLLGIQTNFITDIVEAKKGEYWLSSPSGLIHLKEEQLMHDTKAVLSHYKGIGGIQVDSMGDLWFNCHRAIFRYNGHQVITHLEEKGENGPLTFKIYRDHLNRLWFVGFGGAYRYENGELLNITKKGPF
ncbi:MAG: hypothetical protein EP332_04355 [Bacteroidetes bacterium]|nr:MAG: hypothetical protein EP332_04355 [Bacteroidota bacterium]